MTDRGKVMQWLETCVGGCEEGCPYEYKNLVYRVECKADLMRDALAILKEQESKPQRYKEHDIFHLPFCPNTVCNAVLDKYWHYCPYCGTKFYWDEELDEQQKAVKWDDVWSTF